MAKTEKARKVWAVVCGFVIVSMILATVASALR